MQSIYSDQRTWLHSVSAGLKLLAVMCLGVGLYATSNQLLLSIAFVFCVLVYASLGRVGWRARRLLMPLLLACLLVLGFHAYMQQIDLGLVSALRMLSISLMGVAFTLTTPSAGLLHTLEWLMQPLHKLGVQTHRIALQLALMLRFIEHFFMVWQQLDDAHKIRTGKSGGLRLLAPLTLHMLQSAKRVADTLTLRLPR
ncbi:MAG: energy-coupling factor transporter transmembrane protein EcfT [Betaproteobacteria bacterium]|nr:energy-coupling factor transporter transmembrane protein EcfT [Betaproteobacteria bacterium]